MSESDSQSLDMSSDKNLVPKSVSKNSHSFDDRICDDLSEVCLQFLPQEDKLSFEYVSKQFQRTVFIKHNEIIFHMAKSEVIKGKNYEENGLKWFESILKRCPNIQTIHLYFENNIILKPYLPLIIKYCRNLNEFNVVLYDWTEPKLSEEFIRKFGSKLKYIRCGLRSHNIDFNLFPNLHSLDKYAKYLNLSNSKTTVPEYVLQLKLKNLKELFLVLKVENIYLFREVLQKFHKIKHLGLYLKTENQIEQSVLNAFKDSTVLQNLIELTFRTKSAENGKQFLDSLKRLAKKFPKLKSIEIKSVLVKDYSNLRKQLSPLKAFPDLKRLVLGLNLLFEINRDMIPLKPFKELSVITRLELYFDDRQLNEKILTDIDIYLPKLQYLSIRRQIITDEEGVTQMADSLSRLSYLQTICLIFTSYHICKLMRAQIREKCRKITNVFVN